MSSITEFAGSVPRNYDQYLGPLFFEPYAQDISDRLKGKQYKRILELACGTGRVTKYLISLLKEDGLLYATDLNPEMLLVAQQKVQDARIQWQTVDAHHIPYDADFFDLVVCQFGVMFFADKELAFQEVNRVLRQDGTFLFNTWDHLQFNAVSMITQQVMNEVFTERAPDFLEKGPYSFYDPKVIKRLLENAHFKEIEIVPVAKEGILESPAQAAQGLIDGSPLTGYLIERNAPREEIKDIVTQSIITSYPTLKAPMQALVCTGIKSTY